MLLLGAEAAGSVDVGVRPVGATPAAVPGGAREDAGNKKAPSSGAVPRGGLYRPVSVLCLRWSCEESYVMLGCLSITLKPGSDVGRHGPAVLGHARQGGQLSDQADVQYCTQPAELHSRASGPGRTDCRVGGIYYAEEKEQQQQSAPTAGRDQERTIGTEWPACCQLPNYSGSPGLLKQQAGPPQSRIRSYEGRTRRSVRRLPYPTIELRGPVRLGRTQGCDVDNLGDGSDGCLIRHPSVWRLVWICRCDRGTEFRRWPPELHSIASPLIIRLTSSVDPGIRLRRAVHDLG